MPSAELLDHLRDQLMLARRYTCELLDDIAPDQWFTQPAGLGTHVAWQVGHLAMAELRLCVFYLRPMTPADHAVMSDAFMAHFRKGAVPSADPQAYPPWEDILRTFHAVHEYVLANWRDYATIDLLTPCLPHHRVGKVKLDMLAWVTRHEMIHAGQIGLLRRLLGRAPLW